jgi:hypothetical protein
MGWTRSAHTEIEIPETLVQEPQGKNNFHDLGVDRRIILKWMLKENGVTSVN